MDGTAKTEELSEMRTAKRHTVFSLAKKLNVPAGRAMEAVIKAQLTMAVIRVVLEKGLTHAELARRSGLPRSAVTGILSGSLQRVTINRVLRLVDAAGLIAEIKVRPAA
ncbi:MAG TPA: XRE family transcriptional regulator [Bdellovibrionota bacterium]|nr:XRE family transcriptional regulator [Bdellovibrionota bacterium]